MVSTWAGDVVAAPTRLWRRLALGIGATGIESGLDGGSRGHRHDGLLGGANALIPRFVRGKLSESVDLVGHRFRARVAQLHGGMGGRLTVPYQTNRLLQAHPLPGRLGSGIGLSAETVFVGTGRPRSASASTLALLGVGQHGILKGQAGYLTCLQAGAGTDAALVGTVGSGRSPATAVAPGGDSLSGLGSGRLGAGTGALLMGAERSGSSPATATAFGYRRLLTGVVHKGGGEFAGLQVGAGADAALVGTVGSGSAPAATGAFRCDGLGRFRRGDAGLGTDAVSMSAGWTGSAPAATVAFGHGAMFAGPQGLCQE